MSRRTGAGRHFVDELLGALPPGEAQRAVERVLRAWEGLTLYLPRKSRQRARMHSADVMIASGVPPRDQVRILRERFGVSEATARRDLRRSPIKEK